MEHFLALVSNQSFFGHPFKIFKLKIFNNLKKKLSSYCWKTLYNTYPILNWIYEVVARHSFYQTLILTSCAERTRTHVFMARTRTHIHWHYSVETSTRGKVINKTIQRRRKKRKETSKSESLKFLEWRISCESRWQNWMIVFGKHTLYSRNYFIRIHKLV